MVVYLRVREGLRANRPWSILEMSFILGLDYIHIGLSEGCNEDKKAGHCKQVLGTEIILEVGYLKFVWTATWM